MQALLFGAGATALLSVPLVGVLFFPALVAASSHVLLAEVDRPRLLAACAAADTEAGSPSSGPRRRDD
jgi:hypothetical protein